jgi:sugar/nucleoside kinase (ribokinase family)
MQKGVRDLVARGALIKASERDLNQLAGKRGLSWLDEHAKHATWILTRGENGAACVGAHGQVNAPTKRVRCLDRSGAGDAFVGGVLAVLVKSGALPGTDAWKDGKLWTRAMEIGHALGAKSVSQVGATTGLTRLDDLIGRLEGKPGESSPTLPGKKKK